MGANSSRPDDLIGRDIDPVGDHDDLMALRRTLSIPAKSDFHIGLRQQSPLMMAKGSRLSIESFDSGVSFKSDWSKDGLIDFKEGVSPREEMNQELSSEVGWKHG